MESLKVHPDLEKFLLDFSGVLYDLQIHAALSPEHISEVVVPKGFEDICSSVVAGELSYTTALYLGGKRFEESVS